MNLPNALTLGRIFLVPLLVVVLLTQFEGRRFLGVPKELVGAAIFGSASVTDWLDGYLARRRQQVTTLGQLMDPLADKLLITAALVSLVQTRPGAGVDGRGHHRPRVGHHRAAQPRPVARRSRFPASPLGKLKMVSQVAAILLLILGQNGTQPFFTLGKIALWVVVGTAIVSGLDYYRTYALTVTGPVDLPPDEPRTRPGTRLCWVRFRVPRTRFQVGFRCVPGSKPGFRNQHQDVSVEGPAAGRTNRAAFHRLGWRASRCRAPASPAGHSHHRWRRVSRPGLSP